MASLTGKRPHVLIIGAGLGGLVLAQSLRKKGVSFEVFERDTSDSCRGQGFAIGLYKLEELQNALPDDIPPLKSSCHLLPLELPSQVVFYARGNRVGVTDTPATPCLRTNRLRLRQLLSTNIPIQWRKEAVRIKEDEESVTVFFQDGHSATGDVLVGADGTFSAVREHVLKVSNFDILKPIPLAIILGETTLSGAALERQLQLGHSCWFTFYTNVRLFCGIRSILPDAKSAEIYWLFFYDDDKVADPNHWLRTATSMQKYEHVLQNISELDTKFREVIELTGPGGVKESPLIFWDAVIEELPASRVTLLGDAVHPMTPFRGEGGIHAIKDALVLSELLANPHTDEPVDLQAALDGYQREMTQRGSDVVRLSRGAMANATAGKPTMVWGYPMLPLPEEVITL